MADRDIGRKRSFICISSSSDDDDDDVYCEDIDDEEASDSSYCDEENDRDDHQDVEIDDDDYDNDDESICNRVISLVKEGSDLDDLKTKELQIYLRKHGLRISGKKTECMQRIKEHWRLRDGKAEELYPRSSFVINCTGDVCKGDVVLFTQKIYQKVDKVKRHGKVIGKRIVAGRIVKESYGALKQQHTFTVEVVWSKGTRALPPLFPLLVKGRNLYKLKTYRQRWGNEAERHQVLDEKHRRGAEARRTRAIKKTEKRYSSNGGAKRRKNDYHHAEQNQTRKKGVETENSKHLCARGDDMPHHRPRCNQNRRAEESFRFQPRHQRLDPPCEPQTLVYDRRPPFHPPTHGTGRNSIRMGSPQFGSHSDTFRTQSYDGSKGSYSHHTYSNNHNNMDRRQPEHFPGFRYEDRQEHLPRYGKEKWRDHFQYPTYG